MSSSARRLLLRLLLLPGLWMVAAPALSSSIPGVSAPLAAQEVSAPAAEPARDALPRRDAPPRTLRAQAHVYVAFAVAWLLLFGYAVWVGRRFARVEREVEALGRPV